MRLHGWNADDDEDRLVLPEMTRIEIYRRLLGEVAPEPTRWERFAAWMKGIAARFDVPVLRVKVPASWADLK